MEKEEFKEIIEEAVKDLMVAGITETIEQIEMMMVLITEEV